MPFIANKGNDRDWPRLDYWVDRVVKWLDNWEVHLVSTYDTLEPVSGIELWDKRNKQHIQVPCTSIVKSYNSAFSFIPYENRWLTALTKIKFVEKYKPCMKAGLETSNSFGYARTAYDTRRANRPVPGEALRAHAQPHLRADQPAYISACHTHGLTHKLVTLPSRWVRLWRPTQGASVREAGTVYDPRWGLDVLRPSR